MDIVIVRSGRKTVSLSVDRQGKAVVRAPRSMRAEEISAFVARHRVWLERRMAEGSKRLSLADGETLVLFGVPFRVCTGSGGIDAERGVLFLPKDGRETELKALITGLSERTMRTFVQRLSERYGFICGAVRVSSARSRWGSCSAKGDLSFSFRIAFLPKETAEYVALHELCHTLHMNHGAAFWKAVERRMPDYRERRSALKAYRWIMNAL